MAEDKKSFVVYHDIKEVLDDLTDEQAGKLFRTMVNYSVEGSEQPLDGVLKFIFIPIRQQMDRDSTKWEGIREKRVEAGRKGGIRSGESRRKANEANALSASSNEANEAVNVTATVNGTVNANATVNGTTTVTVPSGGRYKVEDEFNLWKKLTPEDIDVLYEKFPNSGGLLIDEVFAEVKAKKTKVKSGLNYILGYAKKVGWDDNADHFDGGGMS